MENPAGYHFGPKATQKVFAMVAFIIACHHSAILDALIGDDANNPNDEQIKALVNDP